MIVVIKICPCIIPWNNQFPMNKNVSALSFVAVPEWFAAGAFGLVTVFTLLLRNVPALQSNLL